jgi:heme-degrading monooxygenase HmoA
MKMRYHLAQLNIGKIKYPLDDPRMAGFVDNLDKINVLAEATPGFVWRLQDDHGNATSITAFDDPNLLVNMSVWESAEALKAYVYKSEHRDFLQRRQEWFKRVMPYMVMWWVPAGHIPTVGEAKERLAHLEQYGDTAHAFTFRKLFEREDGLENT